MTISLDSDKEREWCQRILHAVKSHASGRQVLTLTVQAGELFPAPFFPYVYAAIMLARAGRIQDAVLLLNPAINNPFACELKDLLEQQGEFRRPAKAFDSALPYAVFTSTDFYRCHQKAVLEVVREYVIAHAMPDDTVPTIIDIGPGDGMLLAKIIGIITETHSLPGLNIVLIEPSPDMMETARKHCVSQSKIPLRFVQLGRKAQELTTDDYEEISVMKPIWFVNAALSIHHFPMEIKKNLLLRLRRLTDKLVITDLDANHDLPDRDDPNFVLSVIDTYSMLIRAVLNTPSSDSDKKLCIQHFCLAEAIHMLSEPRDSRTDYHATITQWRDLAESAGFAVWRENQITSDQGQHHTFTLCLAG